MTSGFKHLARLTTLSESQPWDSWLKPAAGGARVSGGPAAILSGQIGALLHSLEPLC